MERTGPDAITLYVPDATLKESSEEARLTRILRHNQPDLDFLCPAWWEVSHTVRLGLLRQGDSLTESAKQADRH